MADQSQPEPRNDTTAHFQEEFQSELAALRSGLSPEEDEAVAALPEGSALLIMRRGPAAGARFLLDADRITAGRHPEVDVFLDDVTVSRHHCDFLRVGDSFLVKDLGSLNGTYRNGELIIEAPLQDGDEVQIGKYRLTFFPSRHSAAKA